MANRIGSHRYGARILPFLLPNPTGKADSIRITIASTMITRLVRLFGLPYLTHLALQGHNKQVRAF